MNGAFSIILAGGAGNRLSILCAERSKPAVPFAGRYRIIDFTLSNCVNSGLFKVAIIAQYNPRSLVQHVGIGRPWDLDRAKGGLYILQPFLGQGKGEWYKGTADAVFQNLHFIEEQNVDDILILSGDHVYTMDYSKMLKAHQEKKAKVTVGVTEVPSDSASRFGIVSADEGGRILSFQEKPQTSQSNLASMGIYVFKKGVLREVLMEKGSPDEGLDFGRDILPKILEDSLIYAHKFQGYWRDVGTIDSYWEAHGDLIQDLPPFNLYDPHLPILTSTKNWPPVKVGPAGRVSRSLVSEGCIIYGEVVNSILSYNVHVQAGAVVRDSIVFSDTFISSDAVVNRAIVDKEVWIGPGCQIGVGEDYTPNQDEPEHLHSGITLIGKGARIPQGMGIGRNCKVNPWVKEPDYSGNWIPSGSTVVANDSPIVFNRDSKRRAL